jgi:hypothetical protein
MMHSVVPYMAPMRPNVRPIPLDFVTVERSVAIAVSFIVVLSLTWMKYRKDIHPYEKRDVKKTYPHTTPTIKWSEESSKSKTQGATSESPNKAFHETVLRH